jgi:hypothetical protein
MLDNSQEKVKKAKDSLEKFTEVESDVEQIAEKTAEIIEETTDKHAHVVEEKTTETIDEAEVVTDKSDHELEEGEGVKVEEEAEDEEDKVNEDQEDEENEKGTFSKSEKKSDYESMDLPVLVKELKKVIENNPAQKIKSQVDAIKNAFNPKFGALLEEKKTAFLDAGGESIDFQFSSPIKAEYNQLLSKYKDERDAYYAELESKLKVNLEKREAVIDSLKTLIEEAEPNTMYKRFRELEDKWRKIGPVPKQLYNDTWKIYHHHVERFYDLLHMSNDFRDIDFKNNLEEKLQVILKAEALLKAPNINDAFKELQDLHKLWKEDIGPVAKEMREVIWQKFSEVTKEIHDKRHDYYKDLRSRYQEIIIAKLAIIAQIEDYDTAEIKTHNDWQKGIKDIEELREKYFSAGKLPYSKSEEVWKKFKAATKNFNKTKNIFYKEEKGSQQDNLNQKMALIEVAEELKDSDDFEVATNAFKKIQADWKNIGHVPRKFSDTIWKRFKAACNHYFNRLHESKNAVNKEQEVVVVAKKAFLEEVKNTTEATLDSVKELITKWNDLGSLPRNVRHLEGKFNKQIDTITTKFSIEKDEVEMLKFSNTINGYKEDNDVRKLESEQFFIRKKMDESIKEIQQLENNLSFFANADSNNPLVKNVRDKIDLLKEGVAIWRLKLDYLRKLEY